MTFNSIGFAIFLPIVFVLYWFVFSKSAKTQNLLLLLASIVFYILADWKFISLLAASGFINYYLARQIAKNKEGAARSLLFYLGVLLNVGVLLYFKYFNFFVDSFVALFNYTGAKISFTPFHILLPLGISFFTFQMIGYLIDVNNEEIEPSSNLAAFFTYLAYFPKILSGPIERVQNFLPQIERKRTFDYALAVDGMRQFLWGLFTKMVIANNLNPFTSEIFDNSESMNGSALLLGTIYYTVQIYADFSGYSNMACGVSKMFNIRITNNFAFPFFSTNISEFWRKWHISLTSWMMDYVFTPINFLLRKHKKLGVMFSVLVTFLLVGLWHGANWTFVAFGIVHGLLFIPVIIKGSMAKGTSVAQNRALPTFNEGVKMISLFLLISFVNILFRAENIQHAWACFTELFSLSLFTLPIVRPWISAILIVFYFLIEWIGRNNEYAFAQFTNKFNKPIRYSLYYGMALAIFWFGGEAEQFIYFQF